MKSLYLPFVLIIGGNLLYHVSQKSVPRTANPLVTMMLAYVVGLVVCALGTLIYPPEKSMFASMRESNWTVLAIGAGVAAVEIGFLLAYRVGWKISVAPVLSSVVVALVLIPVGVMAFGERLSGWNIAGILFCILGLILVHR